MFLAAHLALLALLQASPFAGGGIAAAAHAPTRHSKLRTITMSDSDDLANPDSSFASEELQRTWKRTGKGKKRWAPGDETGDAVLDTRLLYSTWILNPMQLHVRDGDCQSLGVQLVLNWLQLPFKVTMVPASEGQNGGGVLPRLEGAGIVDGGLCTFGEICSFAVAVARPNARRLAPQTDREDIKRWLASPSVGGLEALLQGQQGEDGAPCLNPWGLSLDDAKVLPVAKAFCSEDGCSVLVNEYVRANMAKAGLVRAGE
jgi:hypothetical protein